MATSKPALSRIERLDLILGLSTVVLRVVFSALAYPFRGSDRAPTFGHHVQTNLIRALTTRLSIPQLQYIQGTSSTNFNKWAALHGNVGLLSTEVLAEDAKIYWIGRRDNKTVILHIHGGGYILPLFAGHLNLLSSLRDHIQKSTNTSVSVALLGYTNSPRATYPTQFRQANVALRHLIESGINPSNIILSGDSAGGHIGLCLLSHILHPHPAVDPPPVLSSPLGGVLLISPRVTNECTAPSFYSNTNRDTLTRETLFAWSSSFRSNSPISTEHGLRADGFYTEPLNAPPEWWEGFTAKITERVFISAGTHECFRDAIVGFADKMKGIPGLDVVLMLEEKGIHDSPLMDVRRPPTDLLKAIRHWLSQTIESFQLWCRASRDGALDVPLETGVLADGNTLPEGENLEPRRYFRTKTGKGLQLCSNGDP
ncbi:hypothetical protein V5O48_001819 [Marasmius crinis-equi]|uniref:Alpha/beta hydrolase fold-3 domain-containing protein n=1 Tax=Marasmius crinis-equi TaxID=585013 RepID=A0ABR3FXF8_9AGAR